MRLCLEEVPCFCFKLVLYFALRSIQLDCLDTVQAFLQITCCMRQRLTC